MQSSQSPEPSMENTGKPVARCRNCNMPLKGPYCYRCGQKDGELLKSIKSFLKDVVSDVLNFDSKIFQTLFPLFFRPGYLTFQHFEGKRAPYVPPLRLYLISSVIFFLVISPNIEKILDEVPKGKTIKELASSDAIKNAKTIKSEKQKKTDLLKQTTDSLNKKEKEKNVFHFGINIGLKDSADVAKAISELDSVKSKELTKKQDDDLDVTVNIGNEEANKKLTEKLKKVDIYYFISSFLNHLPTTLIFFIPIWALFMKLLYPFSNRYYMEHLVFNHHVHAFVLLYYSILIGLNSVLTHFKIIPTEGVEIVSLIVIPMIYILLAFHFYYRQKWWLLLLKVPLIYTLYIIVISVVVVFAAIAELWVAKV